MKKTLLPLILALTLGLSASAQNFNFSQSTATYTDLPAPTLISTNVIWDDIAVVVPIGFTFALGNHTFSNVEITSNGVLLFNNGVMDAAVVGYDADLQSLGSTVSTSPIGYEVTGPAGSRIFKAEWKNAGFYDGSGSDNVNVQVWLYEGTNAIETHIGASTIVNPLDIFGSFGGPANGVAPFVDFSTEILSGVFLQGSPAAANPVPLVNSLTYPFLNAPPANGTVYRYTPGVLAVDKEKLAADLSLYPNPATEELHLEGLQAVKGNLTLNVYNTLGKLVLTRQLAPAQRLAINVRALPQGTYLLEMTAGQARTTRQFVKL